MTKRGERQSLAADMSSRQLKKILCKRLFFVNPMTMPSPSCLSDLMPPSLRGILLRLGLALLAATSFVSCDTLAKSPVITFHSQASPDDPRKTMFPFQLEGKPLLFKLVPEISQANVTAFHPFPAETGKGNGMALRLDFRGAGALEMVTRSKQGEYLLAMVNGIPVDYVVIDKPVHDGLITIWQGVPDDVIKVMDQKYTRLRNGQGPTMSADMDMAPSTKAEKRHALNTARETEAADKKKASKPKSKAEELGLDQPEGSATAPSSKLPIEGGFRPYPANDDKLPLPKP